MTNTYYVKSNINIYYIVYILIIIIIHICYFYEISDLILLPYTNSLDLAVNTNFTNYKNNTIII